ncbi:Aldedh-domain-containing protein [Trichodelitschia bisporula]|uniref:aldehyde dehydrogenase (NAD(+)) n=1 Tax=Trichodelitschia bisporula TaxID=703511 RepID=A0A6G1I8N4_9PEZI|nr:Aldedh-domain-containing protein [Trichodelitschia bisporula]
MDQVLARLDGAPLIASLFVLAIGAGFLFNYIFNDAEAIDYHVPEPEASRPGWNGKILQEPSLKVPGSSAIQCYAPATGRSLGVVEPATPDDVDRAIASAHKAQQQWAKTTFAQRRTVLKAMLKYTLENQEQIARIACLDSGKTRVDASFGEILVTAEKLKWTIDHGEKALRPQRRPTNLLMMYKRNEVRWEPLGVIAACVSWNYPFHNLIGPIISGIFAGNGVIVKGSEQTAWSSWYFASIAKGALRACGHDPNLVQPIICWPDVAPHLISHPGISHITFIGSRPVALHVAASASKTLTPVCMELGGKDPAILLDDASDLDRVVATLARGVFQSSGQNCIGIERIICLPRIYEEVIPRLLTIIKGIRLGSALDMKPGSPSVDMGACISDANFSRIEDLIVDAVQSGARLLAGGRRYNHSDFPNGHYFSPTLLVDVTPDMRIAQEELFAPVCLVMRAESVDDAISIANGTEYALGASVWGSSRRDLDKVTREVKAGMVAVNDFGAFYAVQLPFGGVKGSGYGRFAGEEGLRSICNTKAVCVDRWPWLIKTAIPPQLQLPLKSEPQAWDMCQGIVELGYGETLKRKVRGLVRMAGM